MRKGLFPTRRAMTMLASVVLVAGAAQAATYTIGSAVGTDFPDLTTAVASATVVDNDVLLLDPANNGNAAFAISAGGAPGILKNITIQGQNGAVVSGGAWHFGATITLRNLTIDGGAANGVVLNNTTGNLTLDNVTIQNKVNFGVNINAGTVNIINGSRIINNGAAGVSVGGNGGATATVNITGTSATPIEIAGNGLLTGTLTSVTQAGLSTRAFTGGSVVWNVEHAVLSGNVYGYGNWAGNTLTETVNFTNVNVTGNTRSGVLAAGENVTFNWTGGTISGRAASNPEANALDELNMPVVHIAGVGVTLTGSGLDFTGTGYGVRLRNDGLPATISNSTLTGGPANTDPAATSGNLSFVYSGGGGVTFNGCTFSAPNAPIMQGVGGTPAITLNNPVFTGNGSILPFFLVGHTGAFTIAGTNPASKINLDTPGAVVFMRKREGTVNLTNVTAGSANGSLIDTIDMGAPAAPLTVNIDQSHFTGTGGKFVLLTGQANAQPVTLNATNTIWVGAYSGTEVGTINDTARTVPSTLNFTHCTVAGATSQPGAVLLNAAPTDVINGQYSIFDASQTTTLLAAAPALTGTGNLIHSTGGASASGGWLAGSPVGTVNADPQLALNGELTSTSPAVNGAIGSLTAVDYIGTARPQSSAPDIGAHESSFAAVSDWQMF